MACHGGFYLPIASIVKPETLLPLSKIVSPSDHKVNLSLSHAFILTICVNCSLKSIFSNIEIKENALIGEEKNDITSHQNHPILDHMLAKLKFGFLSGMATAKKSPLHKI